MEISLNWQKSFPPFHPGEGKDKGEKRGTIWGPRYIGVRDQKRVVFQRPYTRYIYKSITKATDKEIKSLTWRPCSSVV